MTKANYQSSTIKQLAKVKRPREKLTKLGPQGLSNSELLAIILGKGYKGKNVVNLSTDLLKKYSAKQLPKLSYKELVSEKGIGIAGASRILASFELATRLLLDQDEDAPLIEAPEDAFDLLKEMRKYKKEHFIGLYLNARHQVIHQETISIGTLTENIVHPREVFEPAVTQKAVAIILVHNHPSGNLDPSEQDLKQTERLSRAGKLMGISVIDHILIGEKDFISFKKKGYL